MSKAVKDISTLFEDDELPAPIGEVATRALPGGAPRVDANAVAPSAPHAVVVNVTGSTHGAGPAPGGNAGPQAPLLGDDASTSGHPTGKFGWFSVKRFQKYFDVDTEDVLARMKNTLAGGFFQGTFLESTEERPDLYGPFWVATTLVFVTAVSANFQSYFDEVYADKAHSTRQHRKWVSDYDKLPKAAFLYYGYVFFLGFVLWLALKCFHSEMKLTHVWCIYGYSLTVFLPVSVILIVPINHALLKLLAVVLVAGAVLLSGVFLIRNFREHISIAAPGKSLVIMGIMVAFDVILGLILLFYFQDVTITN